MIERHDEAPPAAELGDRLEDAFREAGTGMAFLGMDGRFLQVNQALCVLLGRSRPELLAGRVDDLTHPEDVGLPDRPDGGQMIAGDLAHHRVERRFRRGDGRVVWIELTIALVRDRAGDPSFYFCQFTDVTERRRAEEALRHSEGTLRLVLESAPDGMILVDRQGRIASVNRQVERLFGYRPAELVGQPVELLVPERLRDVHSGYRSSYLDRPRTRPMGRGLDLTARRKDGSEFPVEIGLGSVPEQGAGLVTCVITDISERKRAEQDVAHQATHDHLTGLPNRALFLDRVELALARASRRPGAVAVLFLDLDRFKVVNDSLGHSAGDTVLSTTAARLLRILRVSDTVARFGGDEFAIVCEELASEREAVTVAKRILEAMAAPMVLGDLEVFVTPSIGIAVADPSGADPEDLLRDADTAMYRAKERGRARYELFDEGMRARALKRLDTEQALRRALERDELRLHYQPIVALRQGVTVVGVEALLRWERAGNRLVQPDGFVPLAEETGLIVPIGAWVLGEACRQAARWRSAHPDRTPVWVSVNLSVHQLARPGLNKLIEGVLVEAGLPGDALALEITESVLMEDADASVATVRTLKELGVAVNVDDFGTGYSSLSQLRRFHVDAIKVDRSFVDGLGTQADDSTLVDAVVSLAHALGVPAMAAGVETPVQLEQLSALGCDFAQGFLFGRPSPPEELEQRLFAVSEGNAAGG